MKYLDLLKQNKDEINFILGQLYMEEYNHIGDYEVQEMIDKLKELTGKNTINIDELEMDLEEIWLNI